MDAEELLRKKLRALEVGQAELRREVSRLQKTTARRDAGLLQQPLPQPSSLPRTARRLGHAGAAGLSPRHHALVMQSLGQAVHVLDLHGNVLYWNRCAEHLYGYSASEAMGHHVRDLVVHPADIDTLNRIIGKILTGKCWRGKFPVKNKHGRRFSIVVDATPLYDDDGNVIGHVCLSEDVQALEEIMGPSGPLWNAGYTECDWSAKK
ncbi:hypothetical protein ACP70R_016046 [Stipagrostis hirtigluma subsp. patula]